MKKNLIVGAGAIAAVAGAAYLIKRYRDGKSINGSSSTPQPNKKHTTDVFSRAKQHNSAFTTGG